jgi:transcriptional regulator
MALYVPRAFAVEDRQALDELIDEHPFATLVTPATPELFVSHVPLLRESGPDGEAALIGHFARANPHWQHASGVASIAIFHGPHAYVSPSWYADPAQAVPTWNLATVHVHGRIELLPDPADAERVLGALVARFEGSGENAWAFTMQGRPRDALVANIAAFRIAIERVTGKFKLSQNRTPVDRRRVIDALTAVDHAEARATAAWMRRFADPDAG